MFVDRLASRLEVFDLGFFLGVAVIDPVELGF
jgi:hypothetical protein